MGVIKTMEMENQREDIVVIFAGYSDKMETFLQRNPGLRSRIAFHVPFADYDAGELMQILNHIAKKQNMTISEDVAEILLPIIGSAVKNPDFGNGRYIRNLLEKARMKQAGRLLKMDFDSVKKKDLQLLTADDFEASPEQKVKVRRIGY